MVHLAIRPIRSFSILNFTFNDVISLSNIKLLSLNELLSDSSIHIRHRSRDSIVRFFESEGESEWDLFGPKCGLMPFW